MAECHANGTDGVFSAWFQECHDSNYNTPDGVQVGHDFLSSEALVSTLLHVEILCDIGMEKSVEESQYHAKDEAQCNDLDTDIEDDSGLISTNQRTIREFERGEKSDFQIWASSKGHLNKNKSLVALFEVFPIFDNKQNYFSTYQTFLGTKKRECQSFSENESNIPKKLNPSVGNESAYLKIENIPPSTRTLTISKMLKHFGLLNIERIEIVKTRLRSYSAIVKVATSSLSVSVQSHLNSLDHMKFLN